jgi:hypothetical protein
MSASMKGAKSRFFGFSATRPLYRRTSTSKRMMLATLAAILIVVSAATTSLAGQQRYEVREGDSIESFASSSGVDTRKRLTDDGAHFFVAGMHVVTVYAHDDEVVMVMDPA